MQMQMQMQMRMRMQMAVPAARQDSTWRGLTSLTSHSSSRRRVMSTQDKDAAEVLPNCTRLVLIERYTQLSRRVHSQDSDAA